MELRRFIREEPVEGLKGRTIEKEEVYRILRQRARRVKKDE